MEDLENQTAVDPFSEEAIIASLPLEAQGELKAYGAMEDRTVEELHRNIFGKHVYRAWDFALTDNGWALVEGNWGQLLGQQTATQVGIRRQFHELVGDHV